ncbi:hypothetical protein EMWEY_00004570 [Eimeria maxima]|uniref:Transmembrane protein n=1 Tax=Eimeria maxima TaxID=5804 RepID=U6M2W3_EIMMA|nr:hypothetical protein EMWEY_00004570 [Eimeria maxima]CDJ56784.1 hypothetical protein EMWEY_00004570 [Eimeria maxima]
MPLLPSWGLAGPRPRPRLAVVAAAATTVAAAAVAAAAEFGVTTPEQIITASHGEHEGSSISTVNEGGGGFSLGYPAVSEEQPHSLDGQLTIPPVFPPPESLAIGGSGDLLAGVDFANEVQQVTRNPQEQQQEQQQGEQEHHQEQQEGGEALLEEDKAEERETADTAKIAGPRLRVRGLLGLSIASSIIKHCWRKGGQDYPRLMAAGFGFAAVAFLELLYTLFDHFYRKRRQFRAAKNAVLGSAPSERRTIIKDNLRKYEYPVASLSRVFLFILPPLSLAFLLYSTSAQANAGLRGVASTFEHHFFVFGALLAALIYSLRKVFGDMVYRRRMKKKLAS